MRELLTVVTRKGQITVPAEIRRALGLREGDQVALVLEHDQVRLRRAGGVVARTAGLLQGTEPPLAAEQLRERAEHAILAEHLKVDHIVSFDRDFDRIQPSRRVEP